MGKICVQLYGKLVSKFVEVCPQIVHSSIKTGPQSNALCVSPASYPTYHATYTTPLSTPKLSVSPEVVGWLCTLSTGLIITIIIYI